ncbi:N-6 DNA methylase [Brevundimonas sp. 2R-24]|uniref:site-specific DNA-methyltransferase (adenine-specific) n=1 Tax=Peiella sedimenti TaxID=3061083 RepID=A0ABT8SK25_9CAUL|nr:N-6 DNA methylase [Caulobacteraceae bacterium XZ-24]
MSVTVEIRAALKGYAQRIRNERRAHPSVTEPGLAPAFNELLKAILPHLPAAPYNLEVLAEFSSAGVGRPDIALKLPGEQARAFIELKGLDKTTDGSKWKNAHDKRQFERFAELPHWTICNFHNLRLYARGEELAAADLVPEAALDPNRDDAAAAKLIDGHDPAAAVRIIERLAQVSPPEAKDAEHLAELLAHSAKLVRGIIRDRLAELEAEGKTDTPLHAVRKEFRDVLYSHPEAGGYSSPDFDELFSGAFAQTLAFGLLLAREAAESAETERRKKLKIAEYERVKVDKNAYKLMPDEHPLMRTTLRVLSMDEVAAEVGAGFEVMLQTVNNFDPGILALRPGGKDPILYFYEFFLETFDPAARERYGVYYTPMPVVRFMVGALDRALKEHLKTSGIADPGVHILDPATGTGTFLLGIAERLRNDVSEEHGKGQAPAALRGLAERMFGFELLIGPYAVAHYRLHHTLARGEDGKPDPAYKLPRLGVYLTDTLAKPGTASVLGSLGFVSEGIKDERQQSDQVKARQEILAIIGNPPYRRLLAGEEQSLVGNWVAEQLWEDLKKPVRDAGWGNQLNTFPELSVAFWRWSIWKLFEAENAPKKGVIAFISNRKYLTGKPYAGLRKMLRERFDRIEVYDLRGDGRAGERAGVEGDQNVFNILTGVAVTLAIADGSKVEGDLACVEYLDAWAEGRVTRKAKLDWMDEGAAAGTLPGAVPVARDVLDDMRPVPFLNGDLLAISDAFAYTRGGMQTKRDDFIYAFSEGELQARITVFRTATAVDAERMFHSTGENHYADAQAVPYSKAHVMSASYRPLDRRFIYNHRAFGAYLRQDMQALWGDVNAALYAMKGGTGGGPAIWCHGLMPDYHAFSGRGGYAFPLYDRRPGHGPYNLKVELTDALSEAYGSPVTPEAVFDAILALLSATSYSTRFAEDLEDVFPHIPFPAQRAVFDAAAAVGAEIRAVETFARQPAPAYLEGVALAETPPSGKLRPIDPRDLDEGDGLFLCADGSGRVAPIPRKVWEFAVSGYRVVPRWLSAREGIDATAADFIPQLRDLVGRVGELIDLFDKADSLLEQTLSDPLSRESLDFAARSSQDEELSGDSE